MAFKFNVEKARAAGLSDEEIRKRMSSGPPQVQSPPVQPEAQGNERSILENLLPVIGGIGGSVVGSIASPVAGTIAGGAAGSAGGEWLAQLLNKEKGDVGAIGREAVLGTIGGVGGKVIGKGAGLVPKLLGRGGSKVAEEAVETGAKVAGQTAGKATSSTSQKLAAKSVLPLFNVKGEGARKLNDSVEVMLRDGIKPPMTLSGWQSTANKITGSDGAVSKALRNATGQTKTPIEFLNSSKAAGKYLSVEGGGYLNPKQQKETISTIRNFYDSKQSGIGQLNADDAMDAVRKLEKEGYSLINKGRKRGQFDLETKGNAYLVAAEDTFNQIARSVDAEGLFPVVRQSLVQELGAISPQLAQRAAKTQTMEQLRSLAAPYVNISKAAFDTMGKGNVGMGSLALGSRVIGTLAGSPLGPLGMVAGGAVAPAVQGLAQASEAPLMGGLSRLILAGGRAGGAIPQGAGTAVGRTAAAGAGQVGARALDQDPREGAIDGEVISDELFSGQKNSGTNGEDIYSGMQGGNQKDLLRKLALLDLFQNEGKNISKITALSEFLGGDKAEVDTERMNQIGETRDIANYLGDYLLNDIGTQDIGPLARVSGKVQRFGADTGFADPKVRSFIQLREAMRSRLARGQGEVGNLTETEQKVALSAIPDLGDSTGEINEKLRVFNELLDKAESRVSGAGAQSQGFDINSLLGAF